MRNYFGVHNHTDRSNIRLVDCINRPKALIDKAIELGLSGIAITDHECLSAHMEVNQYAKEIKEKNPDFKIALGNEIYLIDERGPKQKYYHFILIAKDALGHKALRELSTVAWYNAYTDRGMERVPTTKAEMTYIMNKYKGHVIATSACMGGELSSLAYDMSLAEDRNDEEIKFECHERIVSFIQYCLETFGDDFYIECAPSTAADQKRVNRKLYKISQAFGIPMVIGTDAHYLTKEDRFVHKAYLNSKDGDREVDDFYEFARLMDYDEAEEILAKSFDDNLDIVDTIINNTLLIQDKIENYSLERKQIIPKVQVTEYDMYDIMECVPGIIMDNFDFRWPTLKKLVERGNIQERYWIAECINSMWEKGFQDNTDYWDRLEIEADVIDFIGGKLDDCLFAYFNTFKHYIDLFWECGSTVGPGRGSATGFLSNYLLGITQLDPIRWGLPYWRFLNKERAELPDIDIDLAPSKRAAIFKAIREERGEFGLVQVATFGTEGTKSAVLTACRGYRSEDYPEGIDIDIAQYMSSLIPQERGFLWPIKDVIKGNPDKDRKPVQAFIREVGQYPGLLDIIQAIEGIVNKRSSHASGVIFYGEDPFETAAFMRTPSGDLITCYDLHMAEAAGDTKYDLLLTEISDKFIKCFELLKADGEVEDISLRELYNKYIHPEVMDTTDKRIWEHLAAGDVLDVFQFATGVGLAVAKKLKPKDPMEMTAANAMMRLMSEKGKESQQDRFVRIQKVGIGAFDREMRQANLPEETIKLMHKHCDRYYGCCAIQEQMMEILMDVAHFTLGEANSARKVVAKKQMAKIPQLKEQVYSKFKNESAANYIWEVAVAPQLGYAFSLNHSLPYSFVGMQSIYFVIHFNPIYWNTACLIVNSGATDEEAGGSTDYGKIAKAIGDITSAGIEVSLANINKSIFGFAPDVENNRILFGLKGMLNVGDDVVAAIIANRPYTSIKDFYYKVKPTKQAMVALIKGGAFDDMEDRRFAMAWYLWETYDKKSRLTLQNMPSFIKYGLLPEDTEERIMARRVYEFNRYLKAITKADPYAYPNMYSLDERAIAFLHEIDCDDLMETDNLAWFMKPKVWDKVYQNYMDIFRDWLTNNKEEVLKKINSIIFLEDWNKYAQGSISAWEMEVLCFYYHEHELANLNHYRYGFADFNKLPEDPVVERTFTKGGKEIKIFKLDKICGTCIAKNKTKSTVTLLTTTGVVTIKFRKEYFSMFDKQISVRGDDGVKHVVEKSWFNRGNMIVVTGMRSGDDFISKKYASTGGHQLYRIEKINDDGSLVLKDHRFQGGIEEDD